MSRSPEDARRWQVHGTSLLLSAVDRLSSDQYDEPSGLPGWSRKHLIAHLAANAEALMNLVTWARTGVETPMYPSADARAQGIERGSRRSARQLGAWVHESAASLQSAMDELTDAHWEAPVVTAQGRTVPMTEAPWMRSREVFVHAVDLEIGVTFVDLPDDFLAALRVDIVARRGDVPEASGSLADVTAWLAGRPHSAVLQVDGSPVPALGPWL